MLFTNNKDRITNKIDSLKIKTIYKYHKDHKYQLFNQTEWHRCLKNKINKGYKEVKVYKNLYSNFKIQHLRHRTSKIQKPTQK